MSRRDFVGSFAAALSCFAGGSNVELRSMLGNATSCDHPSRGKKQEWHELPDLFAMVYLVFLRDWLRNANLYDTEWPPLPPRTGDVPTEVLWARTVDGTWNDLDHPTMGSAGRRFGRNVPLTAAYPDPAPLDPNPRAISTAVLTRDQFKPAKTLNVLAAAWIQFQVHDWFAHECGSMTDAHEVPIPSGDSWPHGSPLRFPKTPTDGTPVAGRPPAYKNRVPHWWDGSQLYGFDAESNAAVRTGTKGMLRVRPNGLLELDSAGNEITGFMPNGWIGISLLHGLFALEHNAICRMLAKKHPLWSDDELYTKARLIIAALLAKIHTLEWTLAVLDTNVLKAAMHTNWKGLIGVLQQVSTAFQDSELLGGIVGSPTDHHTAPYAMTEEFVSVYRMHPLMPDDFRFYTLANGQVIETLPLPEVSGAKGRAVLDKYKDHIADVYYSLGVDHPGAITLKNYPRHLQDLEVADGRYIDLATIEIVRDRERGIPRYNAFRRLLGKAPITNFAELTPDRALQETLSSIYRDVNQVDTMIGLLAETPPGGFAFSDTAFRIFILMASRRLKSDRFYTKPYWCKDTYTKEGLDWIEETSMASVLRRHYPALKRQIGAHRNAFRPWNRIKT